MVVYRFAEQLDVVVVAMAFRASSHLCRWVADGMILVVVVLVIVDAVNGIIVDVVKLVAFAIDTEVDVVHVVEDVANGVAADDEHATPEVDDDDGSVPASQQVPGACARPPPYQMCSRLRLPRFADVCAY